MKWRKFWGCHMSEQKFDQLLSGTVDTVLETMFFTQTLGPAEPESGTGQMEAGSDGLPKSHAAGRSKRSFAAKCSVDDGNLSG